MEACRGRELQVGELRNRELVVEAFRGHGCRRDHGLVVGAFRDHSGRELVVEAFRDHGDHRLEAEAFLGREQVEEAFHGHSLVVEAFRNHGLAVEAYHVHKLAVEAFRGRTLVRNICHLGMLVAIHGCSELAHAFHNRTLVVVAGSNMYPDLCQ